MSNLLIIFRRSFVYDGLFLSQCFQDSVFCLSTTWLWCVPAWFSFSSYYLECIELLGCVYSCIPSNLGNLQPLFFGYSVSSLLLLLRLPQYNCWSIWWCPSSLFGSVHFFLNLVFFPFFKLMFKFTDSFLCLNLSCVHICLRIPLVNFSFQ